MDYRSTITSPTMVIDPNKVHANINFMAAKAAQQGVRFRPHFKTHQSAVVGEWFRAAEVKSITVSSLEMAQYFSRQGWDDILVAFSLNLRQMEIVNELAARIRLGVLVESLESVDFLADRLNAPLDVWIKVDSGSGRTGLPWDKPERAADLAKRVTSAPRLRLRGLLTHAGFTYSAGSSAEIINRYTLSCGRMHQLREEIRACGIDHLEISVGDTPGCTLSPRLGAVDEIRPGNFVFFDMQMLHLGVCSFDQVAALVACPLVALHPERSEAVVYGGAVHLSKDTVKIDGQAAYGAVVELTEDGWGAPLSGAYVARLSQEHGILHLPQAALARQRVGELIGIIPAHVCLVVSALGGYITLQNQVIQAFPRAWPPAGQG